MLTLPNALAPSEDEYAIVALLSHSTASLVAKLQQQINEQLGDAGWIAPRNCLHVTLMEIVCDTDYGQTPRKQLFADWLNKYSEVASEIIAKFPPFTLDFDTLHVSRSAIIVKASNPGPLNGIRAALLSKITLPQGTKLPPDIGHSSIIRFTKAIPLENAEAAASSIVVNISEKIEGFKLVEGLAPPKLNPTVIASYPLGAG